MRTLQLEPDDIAVVRDLVTELAVHYDTVESEDFQRQGRVHAEELPRGVRATINEFRLTEPAGTLVVSGWPVDDADLGPTPSDPRHKPVPSPTITHDIAFFLFASLLGDPIAWATQQDGYVMHDVFPVRGYEHEQIGWGSEETLTWHTEDAFHPFRTDYLGLMCLRNPDAVETTVGDIRDVHLDAETRALLFEERFRVLPDDAHRISAPENGATEPSRVGELRRRSLDRVKEALRSPDPVAVLFGDPTDPYVRLDPHYMKDVQGVVEQAALDRITAAFEEAMTSVVLKPGDFCFIDNFRAVHGRRPFRARFDGTDRWLRRLNVARDLRKSRECRLGADTRVIY